MAWKIEGLDGPAVKKLAQRLRAQLHTVAPLPLTEIREALARALGYANWAAAEIVLDSGSTAPSNATPTWESLVDAERPDGLLERWRQQKGAYSEAVHRAAEDRKEREIFGALDATKRPKALGILLSEKHLAFPEWAALSHELFALRQAVYDRVRREYTDRGAWSEALRELVDPLPAEREKSESNLRFLGVAASADGPEASWQVALKMWSMQWSVPNMRPSIGRSARELLDLIWQSPLPEDLRLSRCLDLVRVRLAHTTDVLACAFAYGSLGLLKTVSEHEVREYAAQAYLSVLSASGKASHPQAAVWATGTQRATVVAAAVEQGLDTYFQDGNSSLMSLLMKVGTVDEVHALQGTGAHLQNTGDPLGVVMHRWQRERAENRPQDAEPLFHLLQSWGIGVRTSWGWKAALSLGDASLLSRLIDQKLQSDPNSWDDLLLEACGHRTPVFFDAVVTAGVPLGRHPPGRLGVTGLVKAACALNTNVVERLLAEGVPTTPVWWDENSPAFHAMREAWCSRPKPDGVQTPSMNEGVLACVLAWLERPTDSGFAHPLEDILPVVRALVAGGVPLAAPADDDRTPFSSALCRVRRPEVAQLLLEHGDDPNARQTKQHYRCSVVDRLVSVPEEWPHCRRVLDVLVSAGLRLNDRHPHSGHAPLHSAVAHAVKHPSHEAAIRWLLDHGADPNLPALKEEPNAVPGPTPCDLLESLPWPLADHERRDQLRAAMGGSGGSPRRKARPT